jgi:ribosomal protein L40E
MKSLRQFIARIRKWAWLRRAERRVSVPQLLDFASYSAPIHREVSSNGVRVYSLCSGCGSRLHASATLCEECAQKRSRPTRPI